jgi:DNA-binding CsgD family transcriptional regulator
MYVEEKPGFRPTPNPFPPLTATTAETAHRLRPASEQWPVVLTIFDQLSVGIVVLDGFARVVFANAAARSLSNGGTVHLNAGLTSPSPPHARRLTELIRSALGGTPVGTMSLPSPGSGRPLMVLVSPVRADGPGNMHDAAAMVMLCDPDRPAQIPAHWIMDAYGLTLAEVRVALAMSCGATIPATARQLQISPNTVKTHLRRVFSKTGTSRQTELARLMATISLATGNQSDG